MCADKCVSKCQQVLQGIERWVQAEDESMQLVLTPCGLDDPGVGC